MTTTTPSLTGLAEAASQAATALAVKLEKGGYSAPSFEQDGLADYPKDPEIIGLRMQLLDATTDLYRLALGPTDSSFMGPLLAFHDASVTNILNQFNFWNAVPIGGSATYAEITARVHLPESIVRLVLKYAISIRIFAGANDKPDSVCHTSLSALPARNRLYQNWLRHLLEEAGPGSLHVAESLRKFSNGKQEPSKPKGWRSARFAECMQVAASASVIKTDDLLKSAYDWNKLGEATVVDIGGSSGHDSTTFSQAFPNLKFIVQDLPQLQTSFDEQVPAEIKSRVNFEPHDFLQPQNTQGDVYMLKMVLHDWPDKYAANILRHLVPHLESGSRILLVEAVAPPDTAALPFATLSHMLNATDMHMLQFFNSQERNLQDWTNLFAKVDERLTLTYVSEVPGSVHQFLEVGLRT
ncbi:O-methyltransferase-domain-containing protein [Fusarium oxysporum Fo47]|uniref:O-methyltransferase-domain-containing protein n=1 Tax=Fusarium oxysporum Fo47 TaxID=660027 RepID=UPI002869A3C2|nr:O-methyltransferase-domain-containing protein [Fusarium oxysporum Fo47]QKD62578.2 O-methyltransferase-domain-containing protein [Fusarium oxysporum Fo47]